MGNANLWLGAAVGALISAVINGLFNWMMKRRELDLQRMQVALRCAELKNQQLIAVQGWATQAGRPGSVEFWDPLASVLEYVRGVQEFEKTGKWAKGEDAIRRSRTKPPSQSTT